MKTDFRLRLLFVRHAMSVDNYAWRKGFAWPGIPDAPLCREGLDSLKRIASSLSAWNPEIVISSPLTRCIQTARAICFQSGASLSVDYALTEIIITHGDRPPPPEELKALHADISVISCNNDGESIMQRVEHLFSRLSSLNDRRICLVGHRGWFETVTGQDIDNGEVVILEIDLAKPTQITIAMERYDI